MIVCRCCWGDGSCLKAIPTSSPLRLIRSACGPISRWLFWMDLHFSKRFPELKSTFNKHSHTALKYCDLGINLIRTFDKSIRRILRNPWILTRDGERDRDIARIWFCFEIWRSCAEFRTDVQTVTFGSRQESGMT